MTGCGYFWNKLLEQRDPGMMHPESPARYRLLESEDICKDVEDLRPYQFATRGNEILSAVHEEAYIEEVMTAYASNRRSLDSGDTRVTKDLFEQALLSASAGPEAIDKVFAGELSSAFCAVRPPGHHANKMRALGFCVFNNVAIAARYAQQRYDIERVLILDWDVHPGNGTQEIFWDDPSVYTLSFHQQGLFGVSGDEKYIGEGAGENFNRNVPFPAGTDGVTYIPVFREVLQSVVESFQPELLIIAAGFDAHKSDSAAELSLVEDDYHELTKIALECTSVATSNRTISILEGGYNPSVLRSCVISHCAALVAFSP